MIRWALARRYSEDAGAAAPGDGGIDIWDEVRPVVGGARRLRRAVADWRRPDWPSWPGWPGRRGGEAADRPGPAGTAANAGEHRISEDDLDDRLARLRGGRPERAGRVLAGVAANLFRAKGEPLDLAGAGNDPEERPDGWSDVECMLAGEEGSRTAVMCVSRPSGAPVDAGMVAGFRRECEEAGVERAVVITDSAFSDRCRLEENRDGTKVELWDWPKMRRELRTHLLGMRDRSDAGPLD
ncbi:MAG: restriction endonuclease [Nitrosopumilaceae archaeon]|nr:restriction endonuclease [Nitrosopumilaceae archaeon]